MNKFTKILITLILSFSSLSASDHDFEWNLSNIQGMPDSLKPMVTSLDLSNSDITSLDEIITFTNIKKLGLSGCYEVLSDLPKLSALTKLEELDLSGFYPDCFYDEDLSFNQVPSLGFLLSLPKLKILNLSRRIYCLTNIDQIVRFPTLRVLNITRCTNVLDPSRYSSNVKIIYDVPMPYFIVELPTDLITKHGDSDED